MFGEAGEKEKRHKRQRQWIKEVDLGIESFYKIHSCGYLYDRIF